MLEMEDCVMNRLRYLVTALILLVLATAGVSYAQDPAEQVESEGKYFNYVGGEVSEFRPSTERVVVKLRGAKSRDSQRARLNMDPDFRGGDHIQEIRATGQWIVELSDTAKRQGKKGAEVMRRLAAEDDVESALPIFEIFPGFEEACMEEFYVSLPKGVPLREVEALCAKYGVDLTREMDYGGLGITGYWLKTSKRSRLSAPLMLRVFVEHFRAAGHRCEGSPATVALYPTLASWSTPNDPARDMYTGNTGEYDLDSTAGAQSYLKAINHPLLCGDHSLEVTDVMPGIDRHQYIVTAVIDAGVQLYYPSRTGGEGWAGGSAAHPDLSNSQWTDPDPMWDSHTDGYSVSEGHGSRYKYGWEYEGCDHWLGAQSGTQWAHGTRAAGVIAAHTNNTTGIVGIAGGWGSTYPPSKIMPIKYLEGTNPDSFSEIPQNWANDSAPVQALSDGIYYAANHGAHVISMSLGFLTQSAYLNEAIRYAKWEKNCVLVAAAHNYDLQIGQYVQEIYSVFHMFPAESPGVICVGGANAGYLPECLGGCSARNLPDVGLNLNDPTPCYMTANAYTAIADLKAHEDAFMSVTGRYEYATDSDLQRKYGGRTGSIWTGINPKHTPMWATEGSWGSDFGPCLDIMAPSQYVSTTNITWYETKTDQGDHLGTPAVTDSCSQQPGGCVTHIAKRFKCTSSATPQVAGAAAAILAASIPPSDPTHTPSLTANQVQAVLQFAAQDMDYTRGSEDAGPGRDIYTGYGFLDVDSALKLAVGGWHMVRLEDRDNATRTALSFDRAGNMVVEGDLLLGQTAQQRAASSSTQEYIIRSGASDNLLIIKPHGQAYEHWFDVHIKGLLIEKGGAILDNLPSGSKYFKIQAKQADASVKVVAVVNKSAISYSGQNFPAGSIILRGRAFIGANPDRSASQGI